MSTHPTDVLNYTIHVPDDFQHLEFLEHKVNQLGLTKEFLPHSKSFRLGGVKTTTAEFLKYVKKYKTNGVTALSANNASKVTRTNIARVRLQNNATSYFTPTSIATVYGLTSTPKQRVGVAIIELGGGYNPSDLSAYWSGLGLTTIPNVSAISVDGAQNTPGSDADYEVALDIEVIGGICPNSNIYVYFAPNTDSGFYDAINAAITSTTNPVSVVSISWGSGENYWSSTTLQSYNTLLQKAAQLGITVCVASGDGSSSDGESSGNHVDFPASSPWALSCGGTHLVCPNGIYSSSTTSETVWGSGSATASGGGGGFSTVFARPSYQTVAAANYTTPGRGVPDVCGDADPATGWQIYIYGAYTVIGGTSAVAPMWAALLASTSVKQFANTVLYSAWQVNPKIVHDITSGSEGFPAGPGWDPASGLGSPNGSLLLPILSGNPGTNTITITTVGNQTGTVGTAISLQIQATDSASGQTLTYIATGLPTGLAVNSATGLITGIPTVAGTSSVTVTVTDITGASGSTTFSWTIAGTKNTITVTNPGTQSSAVGATINLQIQATDSTPSQILTYSATGLPMGLAITPSTGNISGIPTVVSTSTVIVSATDATGASGSTTFTWTINGAKNTITVINPGNQTNALGTTANLQIKATDSASGQNLVYSATGLPDALTINSATGLISGMVLLINPYTVTVVVTDSTGASGSTTFTWTVDTGPTNVVTLNTMSDYTSAIAQKKAIIEYGATWCGACAEAAPIYAQLSLQYTDIKFCYINIQNPNFASLLTQYNINAFPTFQYFYQGKIEDTQIGANTYLSTTKTQHLESLP